MNKTTITGKIIHGTGDGKKIGFPTINIDFEEVPDINPGVYASRVKIDEKWHGGVMHYGPRLIFGEEQIKLEIHIIDFEEDVYDKKVEVEVKDFIRQTKKFKNFDELIDQINKDRTKAKITLSNESE